MKATGIVRRIDYMGRRIGKRLFSHFLSTTKKDIPVTVNASDFGIPIYERLGFKKDGERKEENGMVYTPMKYVDKERKN